MRAKTLRIALGIGLFSIAGHASIIETDSLSNTGFTILGGSLIAGLLPTSISGTTDQENLNSDTTGAALTNGAFGPAGLIESGGPNPDMTIINNGALITYSLLGPSTITEIDTYAGWRDPGRSQQDYIVSISTDGTNFSPLFTVGSINISSSPSDVEVALTSNSGPLATGVEAIQFSFPSTENGYVGYREISVLGVSAAPEPGALVLLSVGCLGLLAAAVARRKRSAAGC